MPSDYRPMPYGGASDIARSIQAAHQPVEHWPAFWTRNPQRCRCGDPHPCRANREATQVIPVPLGTRTRHEPTWLDYTLLSVAVVAGLAAITVGWMLIGAWS